MPILGEITGYLGEVLITKTNIEFTKIIQLNSTISTRQDINIWFRNGGLSNPWLTNGIESKKTSSLLLCKFRMERVKIYMYNNIIT